MHIAEGVLSTSVIISGAAIAAAGTGIGLKKLNIEDIPKTAVLASAMFVASLIRIPVGPSSVHLILNGLAGLLLGWRVFPTMLVALLLQAVLFGYGGLVVLGVNTAVMAIPGLFGHYLLRGFLPSTKKYRIFLTGFFAGFIGIAGACVLLALSLFLSSKTFLPVIKLTIAANLPAMLIEGLVSGFVIVFLMKVKPDLLNSHYEQMSAEV